MKSIATTVSLRMMLLVSLLAGGLTVHGQAQSRIGFNGHDVFLSGTNIAWVNFAADLGPGTLDTLRFRAVFDSLHAHGGNALRLWLHTNGTQTPEFDGTGRVISPGTKAAAYLNRILDMAWQRKVGLLLCLWSFDMQRKSIGSLYTSRNALLLTDTSYTRSYIAHALIPLVEAVKAHPAIIAWEVFNEAEGMSDEYGWSDIYHVPIANIQRFVNLTAAAIHRTDATARVTTGAWDLVVETDVNPLPKRSDPEVASAQLTAAEVLRIERNFYARYGIRETARQILSHYQATNVNYYRDDRLITLGGDSLGILDFYTSHYYNNGQGTSLCPFLHPAAVYGLSKPLVIAEFWPEDVLTVSSADLYRLLFDYGYAGGLSWGWYSGGTGHDQATLQRNTIVLVQDLFSRYPDQIDVTPISGTVYAFTAQPDTIDRGEPSTLDWKTALGTIATLNGAPAAIRGTQAVTPDTTTTYTLVAQGTAPHTAAATVHVYPTGKIITFTASAKAIGGGDHVTLRWKVARGSAVTLNDSTVSAADSLRLSPAVTQPYRLVGIGVIRDTASLTITVVPSDRFNRALGAPVTVAASSSVPAYANPHNAVDGDTTTQWVSGTGAGQIQSISCDLGQNIQINRVVIRWGSRFPTTYGLSLRSDSGVWTTARIVTNGAGGDEVFDSVQQTARYALLRLGAAGDSGFAIREWEIFGLQDATMVPAQQGDIPDHVALLQNFPNPFNPATAIRWMMPGTGRVRLAVYDLLGREVSLLVDEMRGAGVHTVSWDAGTRASGVYLCRLQVTVPGGGTAVREQTQKLVFLK